MRAARRRRHLVAAVAADYDGVVSRSRLRELGVDRNAVAREVAAGHWFLRSRRTVGVHPGELLLPAQWWRAVWEVGPSAVLDGVSALQAAGVRGMNVEAVHVSVPRDFRRDRVDGAHQHRHERI